LIFFVITGGTARNRAFPGKFLRQQDAGATISERSR